jgi:hypothetical protein
MIATAARNSDPNEGAVTAEDDDSKPTFDRVLALFESVPDTKPFDPAHVLVLTRLQRASKEHYARILDGLLEGRNGETLPLAVIRGAQMLHRRMANALAQAALRLVNRPQLPEEQVRCAELALCSLRARADEIKWHAFEQTAAQPSSWQQTNQLVRAIESLGAERQIVGGELSCTDAFAHCLLLCTLNVGILTPPQMELAQRWLPRAHAICASSRSSIPKLTGTKSISQPTRDPSAYRPQPRSRIPRVSSRLRRWVQRWRAHAVSSMPASFPSAQRPTG